MKKLTIALLLFSSLLVAQNNPLNLYGKFTADPTARNWDDGKLWLYTSHDAPCMSSYTAMADWCAFSTTDGKHWTEHGSIFSLDELNRLGWDVYNAWAIDVVEKNDIYYLYFPVRSRHDKSWIIGVAESDTPEGPFSNPRQVVKDWGIDPAVFIDDDGEAYLHCQFKSAKLNADMASIDSSTIVAFKDVAFLPHTHYEGPFAFKRNGLYYYVSSSFGYRQLVHYTSKDPLGPWEYRGVIMEEDPNPVENNHCSIVQYNGRWTLFYHLMDCGKARKVCADFFEFNADGTIPLIRRSKQGIAF